VVIRTNRLAGSFDLLKLRSREMALQTKRQLEILLGESREDRARLVAEVSKALADNRVFRERVLQLESAYEAQRVRIERLEKDNEKLNSLLSAKSRDFLEADGNLSKALEERESAMRIADALLKAFNEIWGI